MQVPYTASSEAKVHQCTPDHYSRPRPSHFNLNVGAEMIISHVILWQNNQREEKEVHFLMSPHLTENQRHRRDKLLFAGTLFLTPSGSVLGRYFVRSVQVHT